MTWDLLILPILVPALTAALTMICFKQKRLQQVISLMGAAGLLIAGIMTMAKVWQHGIVVTYVGQWAAPFGITLVADHLSAMMVLLTAVMGFVVLIYAQVNFDGNMDAPAFQPIMHTLLLGVSGSFLTGDIFNLYVWFEVMLLSSFVLLTLNRTRQAMEGSLKYVTLNLISSALFLSSVGVLYAVCRTVNMADLALRLDLLRHDHPQLVLAMGMMFLVSFGIKAGLFPLNFWLPASYHTPSAAVSALFAGLLTKVGVYALFRTFLTVFPYDERYFTVILVVAGLTMITGVFGAVSQFEIRRILSFHIISQIGYMIMGLALVVSTDTSIKFVAMAAAIFYTAHHIIVKTNLFLIGGIIKAKQGSYDLATVGGLAKRAPWLAVLFLIPALSLAGIPPLSGFWAKLTILKAGFMSGQYLLTFAAIAAGLLTLLSMIKIWNEAFWKEPDQCPEAKHPLRRRELFWLAAPAVLLAAATLFIGLQPRFLYQLSERAADDLITKDRYIQAVSPQTNPKLIRGFIVTEEGPGK